MNKIWDTNLQTGLDFETEAHAGLSHYKEFPAMMKAWGAGEEPSYILLESGCRRAGLEIATALRYF